MKGQNLNQMSYNSLQKYLTQTRKQKLSKKRKQTISFYMEKEKQNSEIIFKKLQNCNIMKLAAAQLKRKGQADIKIVGEKLRYSVDMSNTILKAYEIIKKAEGKRIKLSYVIPKLPNKDPIITEKNQVVATLLCEIINQTKTQ